MQITTFLMFADSAEEAMNFYVSVFPESRVVSAERYGTGENGKPGAIKAAVFELNSTRLMCIDSPTPHAFTFTPSISLFVDCDSEEQVAELFRKLSAGGKILMPLESWGFSQRFGWIEDRFGVSWQLNLPFKPTAES